MSKEAGENGEFYLGGRTLADPSSEIWTPNQSIWTPDTDLVFPEHKVTHNCGIAVAHTLEDVLELMLALQHRGREAAGIAAVGNNRIDVVKWVGKVDFFDRIDLAKIFPPDRYHTFLGHVRYATRGDKGIDRILLDAHPHVVGGRVIHRGNHVHIRDCDAAIVHNGQIDEEHLPGVDRDQLKTGCDSEAALYYYLKHGEQDFMNQVPGAYTLAITDKRRPEVIVMRDGMGLRPGVIGQKKREFIVASEDIAFRKNRADLKRDLRPGTIYYLYPHGTMRSADVVDIPHKHCMFEYNYIGHVDSVINGVSSREVRRWLGVELAHEQPIPEADIVGFVPRCPEVAAFHYHEELMRQTSSTARYMEDLFVKTSSMRSFMGSTSGARADAITQTLHLNPAVRHLLKDQVVVAIEDSFVRGNVLQRVKDLLFNEGHVKDVYVLSYTPPIGIITPDGRKAHCHDGVDMPEDDLFIARNQTPEEISEKLGMHVRYLSREGMGRAYQHAGLDIKSHCTFCLGGPDHYAAFNKRRGVDNG